MGITISLNSRMALPLAPDRFLMSKTLLFIVTLVFCISSAEAQEPAPRVQSIFQNLMNAVQTGDHAMMILDGDPGFKSGLTDAMVAAVHTQLGPRMLEGYSATFLTAMRQADYEIYLWKISFKDGGDDFLAKVVLTTDDQVAGFLVN